MDPRTAKIQTQRAHELRLRKAARGNTAVKAMIAENDNLKAALIRKDEAFEKLAKEQLETFSETSPAALKILNDNAELKHALDEVTQQAKTLSDENARITARLKELHEVVKAAKVASGVELPDLPSEPEKEPAKKQAKTKGK